MKKKLAVLLAAVMLITCFSTTALAAETTTAPATATQTVPFPGGINVSLNGQFLTFGGVAPITADGMTMVPLRAFLEAFGAEVVYAENKVTATLENGDQITMAMESTEMGITHDGKTETVDLGVAPFVMNRTTYLPARAVGEAMGFDVTYESSTKTVYLTDWAALTQEIDKNFTRYNELIAASQAASAGTYDFSKPLQGKVNLSISADVNAPELGVKGKGDLSMAMSMLMDKLGMSMEIAPKLNIKDFLTAEDATSEDLLTQLEAINGCNIQAIMNQKTGDMYLKTDLGQRLGSEELDKDAWYHIPATLAGTDVEEMTALYAMMSQKDLTIGNMLTWYYEFLGETLGTDNPFAGDPYEQIHNLADIMGIFFGDGVVTKKTVGVTTTYSIDQGTLDLGAQMVKLGLVSQDDLKAMLASGAVPSISFQMTSTVKEGKLTNSDMKMALKVIEDDTSVEVNITSKGNAAKTDMKMDFIMKQGENNISLTLQANAQMEPTTKTVPTAPAAGAKILELE